MRPKLSQEQIETRLKEESFQNWSLINNSLYREIKFKDFKTAIEFMSESVKTIDSMNHHPDWKNIYNKVFINLSTHDSFGITDLDFDLANELNKIINRYL